MFSKDQHLVLYQPVITCQILEQMFWCYNMNTKALTVLQWRQMHLLVNLVLQRWMNEKCRSSLYHQNSSDPLKQEPSKTTKDLGAKYHSTLSKSCKLRCGGFTSFTLATWTWLSIKLLLNVPAKSSLMPHLATYTAEPIAATYPRRLDSTRGT